MKNKLKPLAKNLLIPLGLTAATSATDAAFIRKYLDQVWLNEEMNNIMKIVKSLEEFGLLIKGFSEITKNEVKKQNDGFFSTLLGTVYASLLGNILTVKGTIKAGQDF